MLAFISCCDNLFQSYWLSLSAAPDMLRHLFKLVLLYQLVIDLVARSILSG